MNTTELIEKTIDEIADEKGINPHKITWHNIAIRLADKLIISNKSNKLPSNFCFEDETGTLVKVIGVINGWCIVDDVEHPEPYIISLEFVKTIYEESEEAKKNID